MPTPHLVQLLAPARLNVPRPHFSEHDAADVASSTELKRPAIQSVHDSLPSFENRPALQMSHGVTRPLSFELRPAGQASQICDPSSIENSPLSKLRLDKMFKAESREKEKLTLHKMSNRVRSDPLE